MISVLVCMLLTMWIYEIGKLLELLKLHEVRSHDLTYQSGSCMLLLHPQIHSQNCPVSELPSVVHSFFSARENMDI